ncbi:MAG: hypothetical protein FRX48_02785 [Lasallia pustulata]|uniref:MIT domain-containing protein n=1 Tax=Lasallia pustulata TaxID=136370 RepID=A0A5M8PU03_9LECA|nr:MAG: hypothetical protein FRX48_02785 [Lasallia pustulata]
MASTLAKPLPHQRQPSRSNSLSSASVINVQRAASLPRIGTRTPAVSALRSQSPIEYDLGPLPFRPNRALSPDPLRRSSAIYSPPDSVTGVREGVGNLNRWSQSTSSSKSSATNNRQNSFSRRLSGSFGTFSGFASSQSPPPRRIVRAKSRTPPVSSPGAALKVLRPAPATLSPPPIITLPALSKAVDAADSPSTLASVTPATTDLLTPSTYPSGGADYFGEKWKGRSPPNKRVSVQRPTTARSPIAQPSPSNRDIRTGSSESLRITASSDTTASFKAAQAPSRTAHRSKEKASRTGHSRNGGEAEKGSGGTGDESSASSARSEQDRGRRRRPPSQKAMLSKALQKAKHAVLLDNAQNFEGAMDAYGDACALLQQVMMRSSGDDDRRKLEAIRNTYTNRIAELQAIDSLFQTADGKALPKRPMSDSSKEQEPFSPITDDGEGMPDLGTAAVAYTANGHPRVTEATESPLLTDLRRSLRLQSPLPPAFEEETYFVPVYSPSPQHLAQNSWSKHHIQNRVPQTATNLATPMVPEYMPPPLSPWRPLSPMPPDKGLPSFGPPATNPSISEPNQLNSNIRTRHDIAESTSWLDTIDESGGSSESSLHSRSSSIGLRRKRTRAPSGATEAEFDAALDAAVEAAYDDGFEPAEDYSKGALSQANIGPAGGGVAWNAKLGLGLGKQRAREAEREAAISATRTFDKMGLNGSITARDSIELEYGLDEAEEEERMLEEMTRDYIMDDSEYDLQTKSALPRQSDSSGFSGRTWGSPIASHRTTAGTSLSTVAEATLIPFMAKQLQATAPPPPPHPPPSGALPPPPPPPTVMLPRPPSLSTSPGPGVRDRRLSGQNAKQLKIDTNTKSALASQSPKIQPLAQLSPMLPIQVINEPLKSASAVPESQESLSCMSFQPASRAAQPSNRQVSSPLPGPSPADSFNDYPATPILTKVSSVDSEDAPASIQISPARGFTKFTAGAGTLRKTFSSSNMRSRGLTASNSDLSDGSPNTPISTIFSTTVSQRNAPTVGISATSNAQPASETYLFDNDIHSPTDHGLPNAEAADAPIALEYCPEPFLLRPFWLMRCVYQSIAHPRGGYISKRLFIPRDIWRVKNVKLKGVEEKVSNLDLLTAALLKLANVDTFDADALLEEMQSFEIVLDQVQANLSKKLGNEVGVQGSAAMFKGSTSTDDPGSTEALTLKTTNTTSKSYLSTWRKLRSKNSTGPSATLPIAVSSAKDGFREGLIMSSLPMTSLPNSKSAKRMPSQVQCVGPNANYMGALARLCDAAQVLDQIARQVEDPGLKRSSQTHVGLVLSTQHAAEFFGFFICRFVLSDVGMMLDKFIKRGSEWVLA